MSISIDKKLKEIREKIFNDKTVNDLSKPNVTEHNRGFIAGQIAMLNTITLALTEKKK